MAGDKNPYTSSIELTDDDKYIEKRIVPARFEVICGHAFIGVLIGLGYWKACELIFMLDAWAKASR